jgi:hypothetical protein
MNEKNDKSIPRLFASLYSLLDFDMLCEQFSYCTLLRRK